MTVKIEAVAQGKKCSITMEIEDEALCALMRSLVLTQLCRTPNALSYLTVSE